MLSTDDKFELTPQEIIAEVLGRFSVRDLTEQTAAALDVGEAKLARAENDIKIIESGEANIIRFWKVESNGNRYEVRRFENFVFCSCLDFFFTKTLCKHAVLTVKFYCEHCQKRLVDFGEICEPCAQDRAPYLKPSSDYRPVRVGNIRI